MLKQSPTLSWYQLSTLFTIVFFPFLFSNLLFLHFSSLLRIPPFCFLFSSILSLLNICFCLSSNTFLPHFSSCLLALPSFTIFVFSSASCSMIFSSSQTSFFSLIKLPFASPPALVLVLSTFVVFFSMTHDLSSFFPDSHFYHSRLLSLFRFLRHDLSLLFLTQEPVYSFLISFLTHMASPLSLSPDSFFLSFCSFFLFYLSFTKLEHGTILNSFSLFFYRLGT